MDGEEAQDLQYMSALFWVEYLYAMEQSEQVRLEEGLVKNLTDKRTAKKEMKPFVSLFYDAQQNNKHKNVVKPFVLPRAN